MRPQGVAQVTRDLRKIDRGSLNALRKDMRQSIQPIAKEIASSVPTQSPLRGMNNHEGVTRWAGSPRASVSFTPGRGRGGGKRLLAMKFTGGKKGLGFDYLELAGSSKRPGAQYSKVYSRGSSSGIQHAIRGQGEAFKAKVKKEVQIRGKAGYFVFDSALKKHGRIEGLGKRAIGKYMRDATRELQRGGAV
jgi:hypothetical protein